MNNYQPLFILGNPRSGTSLFRIILNNHPNIVSPPECGFSEWLYSDYRNWCKEDINSNKLELFIKDLSHCKKIETWNLDYTKLKELIIDEEPNNYSELTYCVYLLYCNDYEGIKIISDKNNYYINQIERLNDIWPEAKYIHLVRDGRDVACSYFSMNELKTESKYKPDLPQSISHIANEWKNNNKNIEQIRINFDSKYLFLRYEDIITNSMEHLKKVCDFLEIPYSETMLNYYKNTNTKLMEPEETLDWKRKTREAPDKKRIARYKSDLTDSQINEFIGIAGKTLVRYGYDL